MIFNNFAAMEHIRSLRDQPITPERILELHRMLTADTLDDSVDAGRLRQSDDVKVVDNRTGTVLHDPPHWAELPLRLERLCAFANADEGSAPFVHPVVRAILLHFMIGYDHPFADGNGRTARALFYWAMARSGYWLMEFLSISQFLRQAPAQYVTAYLHTETDGGDTTYFILHQLGTIRKSIEALYVYLARKTNEQKDAQRLLPGPRRFADGSTTGRSHSSPTPCAIQARRIESAPTSSFMVWCIKRPEPTCLSWRPWASLTSSSKGSPLSSTRRRI